MEANIPRKRTVLTLQGDGKFRRMESEMPPVGPGDVLVRTKASLVSPGSELKGPVSRGSRSAGGWSGLREMQLHPEEGLEPKPFGYANAGVVAAVGGEVKGLKVGNSVAAIGAGYALHANFAVVPQNLVVPLPKKARFEQGAYGMLLATAMQAVRRGEAEMGEYVAVAGLGIVGILSARLFQLAGCYVIGWDRLAPRLKLARELGIDDTALVPQEDAIEKTLQFTRGRGLDTGVLALGGDATKPAYALERCMKVSGDGHPMGTLVIVGGAEFPFTRSLTNLDVRRSSRTGPGYHDKAWEKGRDYDPVFVRWDTRSNLELCLRLVAEGKIAVEKLTTHRVPFERVEEETKRITKDPDSILGMLFEY